MANIGALCACMGPQGKDKLCPCQVRAAGLPEDVKPWTTEDHERLKVALVKLKDRAEQEDARGEES